MPFDSPIHVAAVAALLLGFLLISSGLGLAIGTTAARTTVSDRAFLRYVALVPAGVAFLLLALAGAFVINA